MRRLNLTLEDRECWRVYESKSRRAALEYKTQPNACTARLRVRCSCSCGQRTYHESGICQDCREAS